MSEGIELADVIRQVRGDLNLAMWEGEGKDLRFRLGPVELELELEVTRSTTPGAKVRFMVVDVEAAQQRSTAVRHHIRVVLHPRLVSDPEREPWVAGPSMEGEE